MASSSADVWIAAIGATTLISLVPLALLLLLPFRKLKPDSKLLKVFLAFAVGGLLGDVFLHLLPHAAHPHDSPLPALEAALNSRDPHPQAPAEKSHDDHHVEGTHDHDAHDHHDHGQGHDHHGHDPHNAHDHPIPQAHGSHEKHHDHDHHDDDHSRHDHAAEVNTGLWIIAGILSFFLIEKFVRAQHAHHHSHGHNHSHGAKKSKGSPSPGKKPAGKKQGPAAKPAEKPIAVAGWLNLAADFAHNFTDGLAIAASFSAGNRIGLVTSLAIIIHEVPHEIGDYAILVQSGFSHYKAAFAQLSTALGALLGCVLGLLGAEQTPGILPFTAGGFIYISTVTILPVLLEDVGFKQSLYEALAILTGVGFMLVVSAFE